MKRYFTVLLLLANSYCNAQKHSLRLDLEKDSIYHLTTSANMLIDQEINGAHQIVTSIIGAKVAHKVILVKDTLYELETRYEKMSMHMDLMGKKIDFSSDMDGQDIFSKLMRSMLNRPFIITMSNRGKIIAVRNTDSLYAHMFDNLPPIPPEKMAEAKAQLMQSFGENAIRGNFQDAFIMFPKYEVGPSDVWLTNNLMNAAAISANTKMNYHVTNFSATNYLINGTGVVVPDKAEAQYKRSNGIEMRIVKVNGELTRKAMLNKKSGWMINSKETKIIKGMIELKDSPQTPGGYTYPISIVVDMTVSGN